MTVTDIGNIILKSNGLYVEEIPNFKWEIKSDTLTVLSYLCQKAITTFRGRVYEAWFSTDIPINNGPWKFCGLPGLILKVNDLKQYFVFECIGIEKLKKEELIKFYDLKYTKISRKSLNELQKRYLDDTLAYLISIGIRTDIKSPSGELITKKHSTPKPYNPMELE